MTKHIIWALAILSLSTSCFLNSKKSTKVEETILLMKTSKGDMRIKLYNQTPQHRDNFVKLANEGYFDSLLFHRVIKEFMIQGGDPDSKNAAKGAMLGSGGPDYTIPAEFDTTLFHKKGALSAARQGDQVNPEKRSSGSQFYVVQGKVYQDAEMTAMEDQMNTQAIDQKVMQYLQSNAEAGKKLDSLRNANNETAFYGYIDELRAQVKDSVDGFHFTAAQRAAYSTVGGTPFLDNNYTVFGEVIEGLEIIDEVAKVAVDGSDRPIEDVLILSVRVE